MKKHNRFILIPSSEIEYQQNKEDKLNNDIRFYQNYQLMITNDEFDKIIEIQEFQIKWANENYLKRKKKSRFACMP